MGHLGKTECRLELLRGKIQLCNIFSSSALFHFAMSVSGLDSTFDKF